MKKIDLKRIATVPLAATKGKRTLAKDGKPLIKYLDPGFGVVKAGKAAPAADAAVFELKSDATYRQAFESLGKPDKLALTQDQVLSFLEGHRDKLSSWRTWFLVKPGKGIPEDHYLAGTEYVVADVRVRGVGSLGALAYRFEHDGEWRAERRHRLVVNATGLSGAQAGPFDPLKLSTLVGKVQESLNELDEYVTGL